MEKDVAEIDQLVEVLTPREIVSELDNEEIIYHKWLYSIYINHFFLKYSV